MMSLSFSFSLFLSCLVLLNHQLASAFLSVPKTFIRKSISIQMISTSFPMADEKKPVVTEKTPIELIQEAFENDKDPKKKKGPPIYEPGSYPIHLLSALAYVVPIVDSFDLGKYMFEAYPDTLTAYSSVFGPLAGVYNSVPFLPFAVFFLMSYICRAPTFSTEVRFHFSQAFMLSIVQFVPSLGLSLLEKAGVQGLGVFYNTAFLWVMISSLTMQALLLNPISASKNPFLLNIVGWSLKYMNYSPDMAPKKK
jgi:hypothetical protein